MAKASPASEVRIVVTITKLETPDRINAILNNRCVIEEPNES